MKRFILIAMLLALPAGQLWAVTEAIFTSVDGKVEVRGQKGHKIRVAQKDTRAIEGERIVTDKDSTAVLKLFDGSELKIGHNTDFWLNKLQQTKSSDKMIRFKLLVGSLIASVKKLTTSHSTFEVESGGVVCGVRGTQFTISYDPTTNTVDINVTEGSVYGNSNGHTDEFGAGQGGEYRDGHLVIPPSANNPQGNHNPTGDTGNDPALNDLTGQFNGQNKVNGDTGYTDPSVNGSVKVNVHAVVGSQEAVP